MSKKVETFVALVLCFIVPLPLFAAWSIEQPSEDEEFFDNAPIGGFGTDADPNKTPFLKLKVGTTIAASGAADTDGTGMWDILFEPNPTWYTDMEKEKTAYLVQLYDGSEFQDDVRIFIKRPN